MMNRLIAATAAWMLALVAGVAAAADPVAVQLTIRADQPGAKIDANIYGQFMEHLGRNVYEGIWVGTDSTIPNTRGYRNDVLAALKKLQVPVLRWPGGCFADEYHWRDGIGDRSKRPARVNTFWGGVIEPNTFGTHEFFELAEMLGAKTYLAVNVGSGTVAEMSQWIEYITSPSQSALANERRANGRDKPWKVDYVGVGNEPWGCGGDMRPEYYADEYKKYALNIKTPRDSTPIEVASGPYGDGYDWTEVVMKSAVRQMGAYSLHYYTLPSGSFETKNKGPALQFNEADWIITLKHTLKIDEMVSKHSAIMDKHDPQKKVGLYVDEWGTWYDVESGTNPGFLFQQNTMRDAIVAGLNLNVFHKHADRVRMTNIAQMINVLQAMVLTDKEKMLLTPTYHVFEMYKPFQNATLLPTELTTPDYKLGEVAIPAVSASAARGADGALVLSLVNTDPNKPARVTAKISGAAAKKMSARVLTTPAMNAHNTFDAPNAVQPATFTG
ncbi:MAG TPA: alpha-L-arabinofuranosidase C-terminal domain-containing protein, partial [Steroidobacteraceae bacterium]|nr:alpha-L-arabinofuranosidase C-terminal domain-containing protein [Steroidobacteraceae bacterium]